jgi:P-type E1-E2 ATPase
MELNKKIFDMAYYEVKVHALRSTGVVEISSVDVVPGDIVFIKDSIKLPFDGILLGGSVLMNECALTG